jgi:hypothetical protein
MTTTATVTHAGDLGAGRTFVTRSIRLYVALGAAALVLLGAGVFVAVKLISSSIDGAIPQADLFGIGGPAVTPTPTVAPTPTGPPPGADIKGPLNFLIVGVDTRTSIPGWVPHGDAVMIMHVTSPPRTSPRCPATSSSTSPPSRRPNSVARIPS